MYSFIARVFLNIGYREHQAHGLLNVLTNTYYKQTTHIGLWETLLQKYIPIQLVRKSICRKASKTYTGQTLYNYDILLVHAI